jgi:Arc/MetJ family transcription regulator
MQTRSKLVRKNLIVDGAQIKRLQRALRLSSESAAVRLAVERSLESQEAIAALERLRGRGTWGGKLRK